MKKRATWYAYRIAGMYEQPDATVEAYTHADACVKAWALIGDMFSGPLNFSVFNNLFQVTTHRHHFGVRPWNRGRRR